MRRRKRKERTSMFDLFGEMTAEEINKTAEGLKNEGEGEKPCRMPETC